SLERCEHRGRAVHRHTLLVSVLASALWKRGHCGGGRSLLRPDASAVIENLPGVVHDNRRDRGESRRVLFARPAGNPSCVERLPFSGGDDEEANAVPAKAELVGNTPLSLMQPFRSGLQVIRQKLSWILLSARPKTDETRAEWQIEGSCCSLPLVAP